MKVIGVAGGLGPAASARFYGKLCELALVNEDQDHPEVIIFSRPSVPDRTRYLLGKSADSPVPALLGTIEALKTAGAEVIALPCVTAHCFFSDISKPDAPVINMVDAIVSEAKRLNIHKLGTLATSGTVKTGLFQSALRDEGIEAVLPGETAQDEIMRAIYDVKAGLRADMVAFYKACGTMPGADAFLLGCTELSLLDLSGAPEGMRFIDGLDVLARVTLTAAGVPVRSL